MDITKSTIIELKALAYDELLKIEIAQKNLSAIGTELKNRSTQETSIPEKQNG